MAILATIHTILLFHTDSRFFEAHQPFCLLRNRNRLRLDACQCALPRLKWRSLKLRMIKTAGPRNRAPCARPNAAPASTFSSAPSAPPPFLHRASLAPPAIRGAGGGAALPPPSSALLHAGRRPPVPRLPPQVRPALQSACSYQALRVHRLRGSLAARAPRRRAPRSLRPDRRLPR